MHAACDRQKSYADLKRKPMEFQVGDKVMLKVSPWKGAVRFGKWGKLNPRYVGPFKVLEKIGKVSYKLKLPEELHRVHNMFYVSNLKKCHADEPLAVSLDGLHFDDKLYFVEEPMEIIDCEVKQLKRIRIPLVKVRWNSKRGPEFTWNKMHKAFPLPVIEFPLPEEVPTASEESSHCQKKREATAVKIALLLKSRRNCQSKSDDSYAKLVTHVTPCTTSDETGKKKGRTVTVTADDMPKRKNDDDLNQKFLTSLAPEWLMHTIVWRNRSDLDTMSLDDLYNHIKVYEFEVQKKSEPNSQNMAFISSAKHNKGNEEVNTASVSTASTNVPTASANIGVASISQDTACAYIASQSSGSQIKFKDINQIDEDDIEEMDIKWNMALLSMRADRVPRSQDRERRDNYRQGSKVEEQAPKALMAINGVGWDWSYMVNDEENHALVAEKEAPTEFALMANTSAESKT
nr:putative reverse transcriptase domain-containing protein [Tanacetum cinerariifolium]